jgi:hypothetical protein
MSQTFARSLTELFRLNSETRFDDTLLNRILAAIETRLRPLEGQQGTLDSAIAQVRQVGLDRINDVLTPAIQSVLDIQDRGFLVARSVSSITLVEGELRTFVLDDATERSLFTPSPYTALTRVSTVDDFAIARTIAYDRERGEYVCEVLSITGEAGPHSDWVIGALAGSTIAAIIARDQALGERNLAQSAAQTAIEKAQEAGEHAVNASTDRQGAETAAGSAADTLTAIDAILNSFADANYAATSTAPVAIGLGAKVFPIAEGKLFTPGQTLRIASLANPAVDWMDAVVSSNLGGNLSVDVELIGKDAAGTHADWFIGISGTRGPASLVDRQVFDTSGTWTKLASQGVALIECIGPGSGGAGGVGQAAAGTNRSGGPAGAGGARRWRLMNLADLPETVPATIGAPGLGGLGSTGGAPGSPGGAAGTTSFGTYLVAPGGNATSPTTTSTAGANGGSAWPTGAPAAFAGAVGTLGDGAPGAFGGASGGGTSVNADSGKGGGSVEGGAGGGGGGGLNGADTLRAPGTGGCRIQATGGSTNTGQPFEGGNGGAANPAGPGANGSDGGLGSGGGGGGGGTGAKGGDGGNGGPGKVIVTVWEITP